MTSVRSATSALAVALVIAGCGRGESMGGGFFSSARDGGGPGDGPFNPDIGPLFDGGFDGGPFDSGFDGGPFDGGRDGGFDGGRDGGFDGGRDGGPDSGPDSGLDAGRDGGRPDRGLPDTGSDSGIDSGTDSGIDSGTDGGDPCLGVDCSSLNGPCQIGLCDPMSGNCFAEPFPDGFPCDDMNLCSGIDQCTMGMCVGTSTSPLGDTCAFSAPLIYTVGNNLELGDTSCAAHNATGSCVPTDGAGDIVYEVFVDGWRRFAFNTLGPAAGTFDTALYLRTGCRNPATEIECDNNDGPGSLSSITRQLEPGNYFLWVDGANASADGNYQLSVDVDLHDTCAAPVDLALPPFNMTTEVRGTTFGANNDFQANCAANANSADHVYRLVVPSETEIRLETLPTGLGDYDTALHIHAEPCTPGLAMNILACNDDVLPGTLSRIETTLPAGTYFVVLDGFSMFSQGHYLMALTNLGSMEVVNFPSPGDGRLNQVGMMFQTDGDFIEGIRTITAPSVTEMQMELDIAPNALMCDRLDVQAMINGVVVGTFQIFPATTHLSETFTFPAATGPAYALRYEVTRTVAMGCGGIDFSQMTSTVGLGN